MLQMLAGYLAVSGVAVIYYYWRDRIALSNRRRNTHNERVAYMLWVAAQRSA